MACAGRRYDSGTNSQLIPTFLSMTQNVTINVQYILAAYPAKARAIHPLHRAPRAHHCDPTRTGLVPFLKVAPQAKWTQEHKSFWEGPASKAMGHAPRPPLWCGHLSKFFGAPVDFVKPCLCVEFDYVTGGWQCDVCIVEITQRRQSTSSRVFFQTITCYWLHLSESKVN